VAATTAGGLAELVAGRGLNSPVGDPEQLAENMHRLLDDPDLAEALANRAHEYVLSEHSLKKMTRAYLELFSSMQG
jgi:glycosyltransferase involved in cell wall biosynthesis